MAPSHVGGRRSLAVAVLLVGLAGGPFAAAETVTVTLGVDPDLRAGTDGNGNLLLFAPLPFETGSSISHWDRSTSPNLLMEPNVNSDLPGRGVDLTPAQLRDVGWRTEGGARLELRFADPPNRGFNDPGLGPQRRAALRAAADVWEGILSSSVTIHVRAQFTPLECDNGTGVLARAGTRLVFQVAGAPFAGTWYHGALAEALSGSNLSTQSDPDPAGHDLDISFNQRIDEECLGAGALYYYGTDGEAPPGQLSFVNVALHEIAHGIGFSNFLDETTGEFLMGDPGVYSHFTLDTTTGRHWAEMTPGEIQASAVNGPHVVWDGANVRRQAELLLDPSPSALVLAPPFLAGSYPVGTAAFGPSLQMVEVSGDLVAYDDGTALPNLACAPARNADALRGRIALLDRGSCTFVTKVRNAQQAGAVGVVMVNNTAGLITMGGNDPTIVIPSVLVSQTDGATFRAALADEGGEEEGDEEEGPELEEPSVCVEEATNLCLNGDRFRIEVVWTKPDGESGAGQAVELTPDTGYFWFFRDSNVELVVKVLDACGDFDRFWVFAAGLTNLEVELKVIDTETGAVKRYRNPARTPFEPVQDTRGFSTCS